MPHNETENQKYTFHASAFWVFFCLLEDSIGSVQQYTEINVAGQQHTNDAAISYTNLNLQL